MLHVYTQCMAPSIWSHTNIRTTDIKRKKARTFISLFLSLCDSDEFILFVVTYMHTDEMFSPYAWRLSKDDAKTLPELLEEVFPHK